MTKVKVCGVGKAQGVPDIAVVQVQIRNEGKTQAECRHANNNASETVVTILKTAGVEENDIYATPANISPQYRNGGFGRSHHKVSFYIGYNKITATVRNLETIQELVQQINNLDQEMVQVCSLQFDIGDKNKLENEARRAAFNNAVDRATTYGKEIEGEIKGVETIEENLSYGNSARHPSAKFAMTSAFQDGCLGEQSQETLEMGDIELKIEVEVCFEIS